jgi:hypothetical protein
VLLVRHEIADRGRAQDWRPQLEAAERRASRQARPRQRLAEAIQRLRGKLKQRLDVADRSGTRQQFLDVKDAIANKDTGLRPHWRVVSQQPHAAPFFERRPGFTVCSRPGLNGAAEPLQTP